MTMKFTREAMQARFEEVRAEIAAIEKKSGPLRAKRDAMVQKARGEEDRANAEIRQVENGLFDLKDEYGVLARALGGRALSQGVE